MKKKTKIIIPIVVSVVVILLIAGGTALYFLTDLFKSPKKLFFKYVGKTFQAEKGHTYDDLLSDFEFYYGKANKTNAEISVDAKLDDSEGLDEIKNLKLTLLSEVGPKQEKSYAKIGLDYKTENLTNIEALNSNNNYGIKCNDIYKDYFYIDGNNLKALATKLGADPTNIPDSMQKINLYDLLNVSKEKRKSIGDRYYKLLESKLEKDNFDADKGVKIDVNGKETKTNKYTLTLNSKEAASIIADVLQTLSEDDETLDLLLEKYAMITSNDESLKITKEDLKDQILESKKAFDEVDSIKATENQNLKISVYEAKGKTVKITIDLGEETIGMDITKNKKDGAISFYIEYNDEKQICLKNEYTIDNETTTGKITLSSAKNTSLQETLKIDYTYIKSKSKISLEANSNIAVSDTESINLSFKYEANGDNMDKRPTKYDFNGYIKLEVKDSTKSDSQYVSINYKGNTEFTDSIDIPELNKNNGVCLNTVTDEELETIKTDINTNINSFIDKILNKLDTNRTEVGLPEEKINIFEELENASTKLPTTLPNQSEVTATPSKIALPEEPSIDETLSL